MSPRNASPGNRIERRRAGRPKAEAAEALDRNILTTALRLFTEHGYADTSMEQIAAAVAAGKETLYRRYPSKEHLFKAVVHSEMHNLVQSVRIAPDDLSDPLSALREVCRQLLEMLLRPQVVDLYRELVAQSRRFPALADHAMDHITQPIHDAIRQLLRAARKAGQIRSDCDIDTLLAALTGMITGWATHQVLLGRKCLENRKERAAFFDAAWIIFLQGVSPA
jgi:AcrR family transcriptional regulator